VYQRRLAFRVRRILRAVLRHCGHGLIYAGTGHAYTPEPQFFVGAGCFFTGRLADEPPPGHPERMTPGVPLNEAEEYLRRQLADLRRPGDPGLL
jgi:Family of unknown function (DUF6059)